MFQFDVNSYGKIEELIKAQRQDYGSRIRLPENVRFLSDMSPYTGWDVCFDEDGNALALEDWDTKTKRQGTIHIEYMFFTYVAIFNYTVWKDRRHMTVTRPEDAMYQGNLEGVLRFIRRIDRRQFRKIDTNEIEFANEQCEKACKGNKEDA